MDGQLVFDWDQLENFFITRDQLVGNKIINTISHAKVEYHMCKYSAPSPLMHRQKAKRLLRLNHDCYAIICWASLWPATAIGTKEYTCPTNWWIIFMYFLEYCLKNLLFRYLVNPMQNQTRSIKWHSAINRSISAFKATFFWLEFWNST